MSLTEEQLFDLKDQIDTAKQKASELKGRKDALMKQLKDDWNCKTIKEAEILSKKKEKEIKELDTQIEEGLQTLEENYGKDKSNNQ